MAIPNFKKKGVEDLKTGLNFSSKQEPILSTNTDYKIYNNIEDKVPEFNPYRYKVQHMDITPLSTKIEAGYFLK